MSDEIKVGDECEIVGECCSSPLVIETIGMHCTVVGIEETPVKCKLCGGCFGPVALIDYELEEGAPCPTQFLRRLPPKQTDEAEPRLDNVPADPNGWDLTHWHPNKTKETV